MSIKQNAIITQAELDDIYTKMCAKSIVTGLNPYDTYIQEIKQDEHSKVDSSKARLPGIERHHIIPRFDGGMDDTSNLVLVTVKEHVIAHWLRWQVLGKSRDYQAFLFRIGDTEAALEQRRQAVLEAREKDRMLGQFFFDPDFQREMGTRGGAKGGSANTEQQFLARQRIGQIYGRQTGIQNQGQALRNFVNQFSIWAYSPKAAAGSPSLVRGEEFFCLIGPKESFVQITRALNGFVPDSIKRPEAMYKLIKLERPQMYGWRIVNTLTRSEVRVGIINFITRNPTVALNYEENFFLSEGIE